MVNDELRQLGCIVKMGMMRMREREERIREKERIRERERDFWTTFFRGGCHNPQGSTRDSRCGEAFHYLQTNKRFNDEECFLFAH